VRRTRKGDVRKCYRKQKKGVKRGRTKSALARRGGRKGGNPTEAESCSHRGVNERKSRLLSRFNRKVGGRGEKSLMGGGGNSLSINARAGGEKGGRRKRGNQRVTQL